MSMLESIPFTTLHQSLDDTKTSSNENIEMYSARSHVSNPTITKEPDEKSKLLQDY